MASEFGIGNAADVRINVTSDATSVNKTLDALVGLGTVDAKNAEQFKRTNAQNIANNENLSKSYQNLIKELNTLISYRTKAATLEDIKTLDVQIQKINATMTQLRQKTDAATGAIGNLATKGKSQFASFGQSFKQALFFGGVAGIGYQVGQWALELIDIRRYIKAFAELQQAEERLGFAVKNIAAEGDYMTDKLIAQANQLQKITQFARKDILEADTKLMTQFGLSGQQVETVMSRIADVAAGTGKRIDEITQRLGAGMEGRMVGLKQLGFNIKYAGDQTKVLNDFMADSQKYVGEAADKMQTLSGQIEYYNNQVEAAKQETGEWLDGLIEGAKDAFIGLEALLHIPGAEAHLMAQENKEALDQYMQDNKAAFDAEIEGFTNMKKKEREVMLASQLDFVANLKSQIIIAKIDIAKASDDLAAMQKKYNENAEGYAPLSPERSNESNKLKEQKIAIDNLTKSLSAQNMALAVQDSLLGQMQSINKGPQKSEDTPKKGEDYTNEIESTIEARQKLIDKIQGDALVKAETDEFDRMEQEAQNRYFEVMEDIKRKKDKMRELIAKPGNTPPAEINKAKAYVNDQSQEQAAAGDLDASTVDTEGKRFDAAAKAADKLQKEDEEAQKKKIERAEKSEDDMTNMLKVSGEARLIQQKENTDKQLAELERRYSQGKLKLESYTKQKKVQEDQGGLQQAQMEKSNLSDQQVPEKAKLADQLNSPEGTPDHINQQEYDTAMQQLDNEMAAATAKIDAATTKLQQDMQTSWSDTFKNIITGMQQMTDKMIEALLIQSQEVQKSNDYRLNMQDKLIEEQEVLAAAGKKNTLAQTIEQRDQIEKQQIAEQQKQKHLKELELFINSVSEFAKKDPTSAIPKALAVVAATRAAEAVFAEEGGIIGQISQRSFIGPQGYTRTHTGGGDVLLHAQRGEGILSVPEMNNLGAVNFGMLKNYLKQPLNEKPLMMNSTAMLDISPLVQRLDNLEHTIKNKKEVNVNWDEYNTMIVTEREGNKTEIKRYVKSVMGK